MVLFFGFTGSRRERRHKEIKDVRARYFGNATDALPWLVSLTDSHKAVPHANTRTHTRAHTLPLRHSDLIAKKTASMSKIKRSFAPGKLREPPLGCGFVGGKTTNVMSQVVWGPGG